MKVWLDERDLDICRWCGEGRYAYCRANGLVLKGASAAQSDASFDVRGARCECSTARALMVPWEPTIEFVKGQRDVAGLVEVRSTTLLGGRLIVHANETGPFVLVVEVDDSEHDVVGWLDAAQAKHWPLETHHGDTAHYVPQKALLPLDDLTKWLHARRAA